MKGINTFADLSELVARVQDPKFQKEFVSRQRKLANSQMEKYQSRMREVAKENSLRRAGKLDAANKLKKKRVDRSIDEAIKNDKKKAERKQTAERKIEAERAKFNNEMMPLMKEYVKTGEASKKLLSKFKYSYPARLHAFYVKAIKNPKKALYDIKNSITMDDIYNARHEKGFVKTDAETLDEIKEQKKLDEWKVKAKKVKDAKNKKNQDDIKKQGKGMGK